ncbi:MAG: 30S ribosomal protein S4e [Sulfolobales archaeon]
MGSMGGSRHLKRLAAPWFYPILRKEYKWVVKSSPGPHSLETSVPLILVLRDMLKIALTSREAIKIINEGAIKIDGVIRKNYKFPVGFMDVVEITRTGEIYRVIPYPTVYMKLHPIERQEAGIKPLRIENKTTVKGGHIQLNLYGGYNVLVRVSDPRKADEDLYNTMDTVVITIPEKKIVEHIPFEEGSLAIIIGGKNVGRVGRVVKITKGMRRHRTIVSLEDPSGHVFQTTADKIFVIGKDKPVISLPKEVLGR